METTLTMAESSFNDDDKFQRKDYKQTISRFLYIGSIWVIKHEISKINQEVNN